MEGKEGDGNESGRERERRENEKKCDIVVQHFLILTTDLYAILQFLLLWPGIF